MDYVERPELFVPDKKSGEGDLFLKELVFLPEGKSPNGWLTWPRAW